MNRLEIEKKKITTEQRLNLILKETQVTIKQRHKYVLFIYLVKSTFFLFYEYQSRYKNFNYEQNCSQEGI